MALYTTTYKYDPNTRRVYSIEAGGKTFTYSYIDNSSAVQTIDSAGKVTSTRHYDSAGRMDSLVQDKDDGAGGRQTLFGVSYGFNAIDQRNSATVTARDTSGAAANFHWDYTYDASKADALATANLSIGGTAVSGQQNTYTYDGVGNRTGTGYSSNLANQLTSHPSAGSVALRYDLQGNLTFDGTFTYAYDSAGRMISATPASPAAHSKLEAGYDDQGRRIWKKSYTWTASDTTGGHTWKLTESRKFVYDGWNLVAEFVADAQGVDRLARAYAWGAETVGGGIGALLSITTFAADGSIAATYLPMFDGSGNVTGLVDATSGAVVATYRYDPFGNLIEKTGTTAALAANAFGFSTKYFDSETGLYYYGYRYYSPELGRWMTRDPLQESGGVNVYGFVGNDPVNQVDALGSEPVSADAQANLITQTGLELASSAASASDESVLPDVNTLRQLATIDPPSTYISPRMWELINAPTPEFEGGSQHGSMGYFDSPVFSSLRRRNNDGTVDFMIVSDDLDPLGRPDRMFHTSFRVSGDPANLRSVERKLSEALNAASRQSRRNRTVALKSLGLYVVPFGTSADKFGQGDNVAGFWWGILDGLLLFAPLVRAAVLKEASIATRAFQAERQLVYASAQTGVGAPRYAITSLQPPSRPFQGAMAEIGEEIASNPVAYRSYRQMASEGVEYGVDFVNRPPGVLGEFVPGKAVTYAGNAGNLKKIVSNMVHESYHSTRFARNSTIGGRLEEYGAARRQELYELGRRPTVAEREAIWIRVQKDYAHLPPR